MKGLGQQAVCNGCHDVLMKFIGSTAILNIHGVDYRCIINRINKSEATYLLENANLKWKKWVIMKYKKNYHVQKMNRKVI